LLFARFSAYSLAQKKGYFFPTGINIEKLGEFVKGGGEIFIGFLGTVTIYWFSGGGLHKGRACSAPH
jgi:hypothetical protein